MNFPFVLEIYRGDEVVLHGAVILDAPLEVFKHSITIPGGKSSLLRSCGCRIVLVILDSIAGCVDDVSVRICYPS
jgi:hypothetical protein